MHLPSDSFVDRYDETDLIFGRGQIEQLDTRLDDIGADRVMIVCGSGSGSNEGLMNPIRDAIGDRLRTVFDETTSQKRLETAVRGAKQVRIHDIDSIVAVGGGSSLDIGRAISVLIFDGRSQSDFEKLAKQGTDPEPLHADTGPLPLVAVPTTFAGADLSFGGSLVISDIHQEPEGTLSRVQIGDKRAIPEQIYYDPELFETTPEDALRGSAMNGFDKGIETIYARTASPMTDATAIRGLQFFTAGLTDLGTDERAMDRAVIGALLVQVKRQTNVIHAVGHGFSRRYPVHQGVIHAIMAPAVLEHLFDHVDARRDILAQALGIETQELSQAETGEAVVEMVRSICEDLGMPTRLSSLDGLDHVDLRAVAEFIHQDGPMERTPPEYEPSVDELETILENAW